MSPVLKGAAGHEAPSPADDARNAAANHSSANKGLGTNVRRQLFDWRRRLAGDDRLRFGVQGNRFGECFMNGPLLEGLEVRWSFHSWLDSTRKGEFSVLCN